MRESAIKDGLSRIGKAISNNRVGIVYILISALIVLLKNSWYVTPKISSVSTIFGITINSGDYATLANLVWFLVNPICFIIYTLLFITSFGDRIRGGGVRFVYRSQYRLQILSLVFLLAYFSYEFISLTPAYKERDNWLIELLLLVFFIILVLFVLWRLNKTFEHNYYHKLKAAIASIEGLQKLRKEKGEIDEFMEKEIDKLKEAAKNLYS